MKCGNLVDANSWKNRREHRQKRERERKWKRERKSYSERIVLQKRRSRAATSSQPLIRTTASSEHNGQRRCLSAFEQTKRNRGTKQKRVGVAVKWNSEWKRKKANWRETERERERERESFLGSCHVCGRGHTGNEGVRSQNVARFLCHPRCTKGLGLHEGVDLRGMYHSAKNGITSSEELAFISLHLKFYLEYPCEEISMG